MGDSLLLEGRILLARGAVALALVLTGACGSEVLSAPPGAGSSGARDVCGRQGGAGIPADLGGPSPSGGAITFALGQLLVRDRDAHGQPDPDGWQELGYDIDCKRTTESSTDVCRAAPDDTVWADAPEGRDNNFGLLLLPILGGIDANARIATGAWTLVLHFPALGPEATQSAVDAELYEGRDLGHAPAFDGSDVWPVASRRQLQGYLADGVWVSGTPVTLRLQLAFEWGADDASTLYLTLHHTVLTAVLAPDRSAAVQGQIAGILDVDELEDELRRLGPAFDISLCNGWSHEPQHLDQAADIMTDGSQDRRATCDGISAGFGFTLLRAQVGETVDAVVPPDLCPSDDSG